MLHLLKRSLKLGPTPKIIAPIQLEPPLHATRDWNMPTTASIFQKDSAALYGVAPTGARSNYVQTDRQVNHPSPMSVQLGAQSETGVPPNPWNLPRPKHHLNHSTRTTLFFLRLQAIYLLGPQFAFGQRFANATFVGLRVSNNNVALFLHMRGKHEASDIISPPQNQTRWVLTSI